MEKQSAIQGATCGAIGAVVASAVTFPLATAKTRLQAQRKQRKPRSGAAPAAVYTGTADCIRRIVRDEGVGKLLSGLVPALSKAASTNFIFYYFFTALGGLYFQRGGGGGGGGGGGPPSLLNSLLHGMSAGVCVQLVMLPSDLVVTRLMVAGSSAGYFETLCEIAREDGVLSLWDGLGPGLSLTLNPGITTLLRNKLASSVGGGGGAAAAVGAAAAAAAAEGGAGAGSSPGPSAGAHFLIGMLSKACASTLTYPYSLVKVQMQVEGMRRSAERAGGGTAAAVERAGEGKLVAGKRLREQKKQRMWGVFAAVVAESGLGGLYRGLLPQLINAMLKEALLNMVRMKIAVVVAALFRTVGRLFRAGTDR